MARMIQDGRSLEPGLIFNAFEWIAYQRFERIDEVRQHFVDAGADRVRLCGAGPSLYAIYADEAPARAVYEQLQSEGLDPYIARTLAVRPQALPPPPEDELEEKNPPAHPGRDREPAAGKKPTPAVEKTL
jgi:4-diphosphocytidyl-2C-methyl-D-erythritol kinase